MGRGKTGVSAQERRNAILQLFKHRRNEQTALSISQVMDYLNSKYSWEFKRRTYDRDIKLDMKGFAEVEQGHPEKFYLAPNHNIEFQLTVTDEDVQMLAISLAHLRGTAPSTLGPLVSICETNIKSRFPAELSKEFDQFNAQLMLQYGIAGKPKAKVAGILREVLRALRDGVSVRCTYHSPYKNNGGVEKDTIRNFLPIRFEVADSRLSILVEDLDLKRGAPNRYKRLIISRMQNVSITTRSFPPPNRRALAAWENSFGGVGGIDDLPEPITLEGDSYLGLYFTEREIHPSQKVTMLEDGNCRVELKMPISEPLLRVLGGFSGNLHRVKPVHLKKSLISIWSAGAKRLTSQE